jgi:hypothetical protein
MNSPRILAAAVFALAVACWPSSGFSATFVGSGNSIENGNPVSGMVEFTISGDVLKVVLTNTTAGGTKAQGDALTLVVFDVDASTAINLTLDSIALTSGSKIFTSKTTINNLVLVDGSWTDALTSPAHDAGVATTGVGLFNGGSISTGNASPNYGLITGDAGGNVRSDFGGSQFPFIMSSLTFEFSGASGLNESDISGVKLLFGTQAGPLMDTTLITPVQSVPEPSTLLTFATLFGGFGGLMRFRRKSVA